MCCRRLTPCSLRRIRGGAGPRWRQSPPIGENAHNFSNLHLHKYAIDDNLVLCLTDRVPRAWNRPVPPRSIRRGVLRTGPSTTPAWNGHPACFARLANRHVCEYCHDCRRVRCASRNSQRWRKNRFRRFLNGCGCFGPNISLSDAGGANTLTTDWPINT